MVVKIREVYGELCGNKQKATRNDYFFSMKELILLFKFIKHRKIIL